MSDAAHEVFTQVPPPGKVSLSTGPAPTPYLVHDGHGLMILGTCEAQALRSAFSGQDVSPVLTAAGKGILILFVCDFCNASHGPHKEFHVTALAAPKAGVRLGDDPAEALTALARYGYWGVLSLHLWNDTPQVVAYNSEYLGLQARLCRAEMTVTDDKVRFAFADARAGALATGAMRLNRRSDPGLMARVLRNLGWAGLWDAVRRKPAVAHVINRKGDVIPANRRARTTTAPDKMIVTGFDPAKDHLDLSEGLLAHYNFVPHIAEHLWPFRFAYLHPDDS